MKFKEKAGKTKTHERHISYFGLPWWLSGKESPCKGRRCEFDPWVRKISWRRKWQPTPVFLLGEFHEQRSLAGYSPQGCRRVRHDLASETTKTQAIGKIP